jgi:hypothetical protein
MRRLIAFIFAALQLVARRESRQSQPSEVGFDFRATPENACFYVMGSGALGLICTSGYRSRPDGSNRGGVQPTAAELRESEPPPNCCRPAPTSLRGRDPHPHRSY